jgi:hypothetical protein
VALAGTTASVLCQYDRDRFDAVTLASVAAFHTRSVATATYYADAVLRICRQCAPPGMRIAGEIDYHGERHGQHDSPGLHRRVDRRHGEDAGRVPHRHLAVPARGLRRVRPARLPGARLLAANAVRHGAGHRQLRLSAEGRVLYLQVSDDARQNTMPPARTRREWKREHAHGLWIIDQLAGWVSLDRHAAGTPYQPGSSSQ